MLPIGPWQTTLILSTLSRSFHYHYSLMIFASSLWYCSFSYERSSFLYKIIMLAVHTWNITSNTSSVTVYDYMKMIAVNQSVKL